MAVYFDIECINDINWSPEGDDPMSKLILGSTDIDILKALSRTHGNKAPNVWSADFIPGKGEGQIFLLHGPPGTGKTYTVGKLHLSILLVNPFLVVITPLVLTHFLLSSLFSSSVSHFLLSNFPSMILMTILKEINTNVYLQSLWQT